MLLSIAGIKGVSALTGYSRGVLGPKMASGGVVPGHGSGDTVPAMLTPGEFVINKASAARIGIGNLSAMNNVKKFAAGGAVQPTAGGSGLGGIFGVMAGGAAIQSMVGFDSALGSAIGKLTALGATIMAVRGGMSTLTTILGTAKTNIMKYSNSNMSMGDWWGQDRFNKAKAALTGIQGSGWGAGPMNRLQTAGLYFNTTKAGMVSNIVGAGAAAGGMYYGGVLNNQAMEQAKVANTSGQLNDAYSKNWRGNILGGAGTGAMVGFAAGNAVAPGIGGAIGLGIGGGVGAVVGALRDNSTELRAANSVAKANRGMEATSDAVSKLQSGKSFNYSSDMFKGLYGISGQLNAMSTERFSGNSSGANEIRSQLRGRASDVEFFKEKLEGASKSVGEFEKQFGGEGHAIIRAIADMQGTTYSEIRKQIEVEIQERIKSSDAMRASRIAIRNFTESLDGMRAFNLVLQGASESANRKHTNIGFMGEIASGRQGSIPSWQPNTKIARAAQGDVLAMSGMGRDVSTLFGGLGPIGEKMAKDSEDIVKVMNELPRLLTESLGQKESPDFYIKDQLGKMGVDKNSDLVKLLSTQIDAKFSAAKGGTEFYGKIREDSTAFSKELFGKFGEAFLKNIDEIQKTFAAEGSRLAASLQHYNAAVEQAIQMEVAMTSHKVSSGLRIQETTARAIGTDLSYKERTAGSYDVTNSWLSRTPLAGRGSDISAIGTGYNDITNKIRQQQELITNPTTSPEQARAAGLEIQKLSLESKQYYEALKTLSSQTQRTTAAFSAFEKATRDKGTVTNWMDKYIYGSDESRLGQRVNTYYAQQVSSGGRDINTLPAEIRSGVSEIFKEFGDMKVFLGKNGQLISGTEASDQHRVDFMTKMMGLQDPRTAKAFLDKQNEGRKEKYGSVEDALKDQIQTSKMDPSQRLYIDEMKKIRDDELKAMDALRKVPEDMASKMRDVLNTAIENFKRASKEGMAYGQVLGGAQKANTTIGEVKTAMSSRALLSDATKGLQGDTLTQRMFKKLSPDATDEEKFKVTQDFYKQLGTGGALEKLRATRTANVEATAMNSEIEANPIFNSFNRELVSLRNTFTDDMSIEDKKSKLRNTKAGGVLEQNLEGKDVEDILGKIARLPINAYGDTNRELLKGTKKIREVNEQKRADAIGELGFDKGNSGLVLEASTEPFIRKLEELAKSAGQFANLEIKSPEQIKKMAEGLQVLGEALGDIPDGKKLAGEIASVVLAINKYEVDRAAGRNPAMLPLNPFKLPAPPLERAAGGSIFSPRGTDTVPAMLTPGEYVVNANATAANLPLLQQINSRKYAGGGFVNYLEGGGAATNFYIDQQMKMRKEAKLGQQWYPGGYAPVSGSLNRWGVWQNTGGSFGRGTPSYSDWKRRRGGYAYGGLVYLADGGLPENKWDKMLRQDEQEKNENLWKQSELQFKYEANRPDTNRDWAGEAAAARKAANDIGNNISIGQAKQTNLASASWRNTAERGQSTWKNINEFGEPSLDEKIRMTMGVPLGLLGYVGKKTGITPMVNVIGTGTKNIVKGAIAGAVGSYYDLTGDWNTAEQYRQNAALAGRGMFSPTEYEKAASGQRTAYEENVQGHIERLKKSGNRTASDVLSLADQGVGLGTDLAMMNGTIRLVGAAAKGIGKGFDILGDGGGAFRLPGGKRIKNNIYTPKSPAIIPPDIKEEVSKLLAKPKPIQPPTTFEIAKGGSEELLNSYPVMNRENLRIQAQLTMGPKTNPSQTFGNFTQYPNEQVIGFNVKKLKAMGADLGIDNIRNTGAHEAMHFKSYNFLGNNKVVSESVNPRSQRLITAMTKRYENILRGKNKRFTPMSGDAKTARGLSGVTQDSIYWNSQEERLARLGAASLQHDWLKKPLRRLFDSAGKYGPGFASGGIVPGSSGGDTVPASLTPGEFVLNKRVTQALANGGMVKNYAGGGITEKVYNKGGNEGGVTSLDTSGLTDFITKATSLFTDLPKGLTEALKGVPDLTKALQEFAPATNELKTAFGEGVASLREFRFEVNVDNLSGVVANAADIFNNFSSSLTGVVNEMSGLAGKLDSLSGTLGGIVKEIKDNLTIEISVKHSPLEVTVNGEVTPSSTTIQSIVEESIKPIQSAIGELQRKFV